MKKEPLTLGKVIAERRAALGLSLKDLARLSHKEDGHSISAQYLHDVEKDRRVPSPHVLGELAKALNHNRHYLAAVAGQAPTEITNYLKDNPETAPHLAALFGRARTVGFTDWDSVDVRQLKAAAGGGK